MSDLQFGRFTRQQLTMDAFLSREGSDIVRNRLQEGLGIEHQSQPQSQGQLAFDLGAGGHGWRLGCVRVTACGWCEMWCMIPDLGGNGPPVRTG